MVELIELAGFAVTIASIWLATRENIWYYPTGIASVLLYAWIFYDVKLYAETVLQFVWLALMLYGWYEWMHGGEALSGVEGPELPVTRTPRWGWIAAAISGVALSAIVIAVQLRFANNPNPYVDSSIAAWSIVAQWMTARKWLESWLLWIAVNVVCVPLYVVRELRLTALLYAILLLLGIQGYRRWRGTLAR